MRWWSRANRDREQDLERELRSHLELEAEELREAGLPSDEARFAAQRAFGNTGLVKENTREMWGWSWPERLLQDLRYAWRLVRLNPGFAAAAIISLALGIGANSAIFQLFDAVRLRALPVSNPDQLVQVRLAEGDGNCCGFNGRYPNLTYALWEQLQERQEAFSGMLAWSPNEFNLSDGGEARYAQGLWVTGDFFNLLGIKPLMGRVLMPADDRRGAPTTRVVISYSFWQREFGGDASVVGKTLLLEGRQFDVIGVAPSTFSGVEVGRNFDVAVPISAEPLIRGKNSYLDRRWEWWLAAMGRLKPGWTIEQATAHLNSISPGLFQSTEPSDLKVTDYLTFKLSAFPGALGYSVLREDYSEALLLLIWIAGLTLLMACVNLGNLMLARASARSREMAIRLALGASRARLMRQLLVESLVLAVAGAMAGAALGRVLSGVLVAFLSTGKNPLFVDLRVDFRFYGFTAALAVLTCLLFGTAPALQASRTELGATIKASGPGLTTGRKRFRLRRLLVVAQVALSFVLVMAALLFVRSFHNVSTVDPGFRPEGVLITHLDLTRLGLSDVGRLALAERLLQRAGNVPGVASAAACRIVPLSGEGWDQFVLIDGSSDNGNRVSEFTRITPGYFKTLGVSMLSGRDFGDGDTFNSPPVAIVNESFASRLFSSPSPLGKRFGLQAGNEPETDYQIVGVVKDTKYTDIHERFQPIAYLAASQDQHPRPSVNVLTRSDLAVDALIPSIRQTVLDENPHIGIAFRVFRTQIQDMLVREQLMATLSAFFGLVAAMLAAIGLFGLISYMVARRGKEIGIRIALGATRRSVAMMIGRESAILLAAGVAAGILVSMYATGAARALLFGLEPHDPATAALAAATLLIVGVASSYFPARRAARSNPVAALRED